MLRVQAGGTLDLCQNRRVIVSLLNSGDGSCHCSDAMGSGGRRILDEGEALRRGQLLEFIAQRKQRCLRKGNAAITQAKIARSDAKIRTVRPKSEICG
jgi:hypothetical protein